MGISEIRALEAEDDYSQKCSIDVRTVAAVSFGDIEVDFNRQGDQALIQAKAQLRSQVNANNDKGLSILKQASHSMPGDIDRSPSIIKSN